MPKFYVGDTFKRYERHTEIMRNKLFFLITLIIFTFPALMHAGGNPEKGLPKVDRLIKERNYNEAIFELSIYMKENPEDFDGAQQRIRRIIKMRNEYNKVAAELVDVLINEPTNDQKKLEMIAFLESLEKNPNEATSLFIANTKAAAQFTFYRAKFDEIMNDGNALMDAGSYVASARKFMEGFTFYKAEFDAESDEELVAAVNESIRVIEAMVQEMELLQPELNGSIETLTTALSQPALFNETRVKAAFTSVEAVLERFSLIRNRAAVAGWLFEDTFARMQAEDETLTDNAFLPFIQRFTLGRKTAERFEGVLGSMDLYWNRVVESAYDSANTALLGMWTSADSAFANDSRNEVSQSLTAASSLASTTASFAAVAANFTVRDQMFGARQWEAESARFTAKVRLSQSFEALSQTYSLYRDIESAVAVFSEGAPASQKLRQTPSAEVSFYNVTRLKLLALKPDTGALTDSLVLLAAEKAYGEVYSRWLNALISNIEREALALARKSALYQLASSREMLDQWTTQTLRADEFLSGVSGPEGTAVLYYPAESVALYNSVRAGVTADRKFILDAASVLRQVDAQTLADSQYAKALASMTEVVASLDALVENNQVSIARANSRILQANLAKQESDLRYNQSQAALRINDFQSARANLQRARDRINEALALQESSSLRSESDARLERLGLDITRIENEFVVREVRALITSGKNFYYQGNIDQAEQIFLQAQSRWNVTNVEPNAEVANWLAIINTALSMKTGRAIPVSAPLYPQMSQILSTVNRMYTEGSALLKAGNRSEGTRILNQAKEQLRQLQLVYPLNQDAGVLNLKIDQLLDPSSFTVFFRQKVEAIRENYRTERQTAYSELLDLYQINPSYPGIKTLLDQVEIYLGIKLPPPDPAALARSRELTTAAQRIYDARNRSLYEVALQQLDEAIKLNPENQTAINLKDRVQTDAGGKSVAVLPSDDEAKYQLAVQELQKGNKITAAALVEQLLQNPRSRNSSKIQDLKKRIDSLL